MALSSPHLRPPTPTVPELGLPRRECRAIESWRAEAMFPDCGDRSCTTAPRPCLRHRGARLGVDQRDLPQSFPQPGWVEHDPRRIWEDAVACVRAALAAAGTAAGAIAGLGITNQRETTIVWERGSGRPIHPAIVWQDRRTAPFCLQHGDRSTGCRRRPVAARPLLSATRIAWIRDHLPGRRRSEAGAFPSHRQAASLAAHRRRVHPPTPPRLAHGSVRPRAHAGPRSAGVLRRAPALLPEC